MKTLKNTLHNLLTATLVFTLAVVAFVITAELTDPQFNAEAAASEGIELVAQDAPTVETTSNEAVVVAEPTWTDQQVIDTLTRADSGSQNFVGTRRFTDDTVLVHANFGVWADDGSASFVDPNVELEAVLEWLTTTTGTQFERTNDPDAAGIRINTREGSWFGEVNMLQNEGDVHLSFVSITCCYRRLIWEEVTQAAGPMGDNGPEISLYSDATRPRNLVAGGFETVVFETLYNLPAGSSAADIQAYLDAR